MNRYQLLRLAEYAAISTAVVGSIAAISTQQPAYAVVPLSVSAILSLVSRQQQEHRLETHSRQTADQLDQRLQRLNEQNKSLQQKLAALEASSEQRASAIATISDLETQLSQLEIQLQSRADTLATQFQQLETNLPKQFNQTLEQVQQQATARASQLETIAAQLQTLETLVQENVPAVATQIQTIRQQLDQQGEQLVRTVANRSDIDKLGTSLEQLQTTVQTLAIRLDTETPEQLQQLTAATNNQHGELTLRLDALAPSLTQLRQDITQLQHDLQALTELPPPSSLTPTPEAAPAAPNQHIPQLPEDENYSLEINLGIDFGTGYTKVCFRDLAQDCSEIVTFSTSDRIGADIPLDHTLIPTKLAILTDGTLLTGLTVEEWHTNAAVIVESIDFIKMRLANLDFSTSAWRLERLAELDDPQMVESLCAYYLSKVIGRAQQWIQTHRPDLFANQTVRWSVNVGVPVEYCDSPALKRFRRVLSMAWLLNYTPMNNPMTLATLNQQVLNLQKWMQTNAIEDRLDCNTTPEIAAAVWSFLSSREAQDGFYTFFDIGDGTLDGAAFRFWRENNGELRVDFYSGQVEPLGVTAFTQQAATELDTTPKHIREALNTGFSHGLNVEMQSSNIRRNVQKLVASVVFDGNEQHQKARNILVPDDIGQNLKVFIGGGGSNTTFFKETIHATHDDFNHGSAGIPPYKITHIPPPNDLSVNGINPKEFNRFAVAYGLCIPNWEGPEIRLPSQIETNESPFRQVKSRPAYEDTKDMM